MTKIEACKVLGISRSASSVKAEQAYLNIQKQLCLQLVPGNTLADRQKAQAQLAELTTAWQVLQKSPHKSHTRKPAPKKPRKSKPATVIPYPKPQTLAEAWELLVTLLPFPEPVIAILLCVIFLLVLIGLLSSL